MENTLEILKAVDAFYSKSFNSLIMVTLGILAFSGVLMPGLMALFQKRLFKIDHEEIQKKLKSESDSELQKAIERIREQYALEEEKVNKDFEKFEAKLTDKVSKKLSTASAQTFHIQARLSLKEDDYEGAFNSLMFAIPSYIKGENEVNAKRCLNLLHKKCLPHIKRSEVHDANGIDEGCERVVNFLKNHDENGRYLDDISSLNIWKNTFDNEKDQEPEKQE